MKERLDKIISSRALLTRSEATKAIRRGRVKVDGSVCTQPDSKHDADISEILLDGEQIRTSKYIYIMMNKPQGVLSATEDKKDTTAADLLPEEYTRRGIGVVGRLDKDATGLLLFTDDGQLNHRITSPKSHAPKLYKVTTDKPAQKEHIGIFAEGMDLGDFISKPAVLELHNGFSLVTISEGKFHQVKRMFLKIGLTVTALHRLRIGELQLDPRLQEGEYRLLSDDEIECLKRF